MSNEWKALILTLITILFGIILLLVTIILGIGLTVGLCKAPLFLVKHGILPQYVLNMNAGIVMATEMIFLVISIGMLIFLGSIFVYIYLNTLRKIEGKKN